MEILQRNSQRIIRKDNEMKYLIKMIDCGGQEVVEYRKTIEAKNDAEAERMATEWEDICSEEDKSIDWNEVEKI